jgi:hypothetical protein
LTISSTRRAGNFGIGILVPPFSPASVLLLTLSVLMSPERVLGKKESLEIVENQGPIPL